MIKWFLAFFILFTTSVLAYTKTVKITVKGMVCGFCAQGVIKKFKSEPAIAKVEVSLEKKLVTLDLKKGQDFADHKIEEILTDAGYDVEKIER